MKSIVYFSDIFYPTFPKLEINLLNMLMSMAHVRFCMFDDDPRLTLYADAYKHFDIIPVSSAEQVGNMIDKKSLYVSRFDYGKYGAGQAAKRAKVLGARVFMYDVAGIDMAVRAGPATYVATKSQWMSDQINSKKFKGRYVKDFITGTIHFDDVPTPVDRIKFMEKYNLDPKKHILLLTPANPGEVNSQNGIENDYKTIVQIASNISGHQLMIKGHPFDYSYRYKKSKAVVCKATKYGNKSSWEIFAQKYNIPVCLPEDGYDAIKSCKAVLNIRSSLALEIPMFYKPVININRHKYKTNWVFNEGMMMDINMNELEKILCNEAYGVSVKKCNIYIKNHCYSNDGMAYKRIAQAIMEVL